MKKTMPCLTCSSAQADLFPVEQSLRACFRFFTRSPAGPGISAAAGTIPRASPGHGLNYPASPIPLSGKTMARILIAYVTRGGSTAEIAHAIAEELRAGWHTADTVETEKVTSLQGYDAVVIGGPMYMGHIDGRVGKFVRRHAADLAKVPVAGFAVGLAAASHDPEGMAWTEKALRGALDPLRPVTETVFAGKLDPEKLSWFQRWIVKKVKSPVGDFRDWVAIAAWARELPGKMKV